MQVEHQFAGRMMGNHRLMHVHRPFGRAGGAAGEVQQRGFLWIGRLDAELRARLGQQPGEIERARDFAVVIARSRQQYVAQAGQQVEDGDDFSLVKQRRRDQHPCIAERHARADRLGAEGGEHGAHHAAVLPRTQGRDVKLGNAAGEHIDALAGADSEFPQHVGETIR